MVQALVTAFSRPGSASIQFNGNEYAEDDDKKAFLLAWNAAVCAGTSTECGTMDAMVVDACASSNTCFATRYELMKHVSQRLGGGSGAAMFDTFYPRLVAAIKNRDASLFSPR